MKFPLTASLYAISAVTFVNAHVDPINSVAVPVFGQSTSTTSTHAPAHVTTKAVKPTTTVKVAKPKTTSTKAPVVHTTPKVTKPKPTTKVQPTTTKKAPKPTTTKKASKPTTTKKAAAAQPTTTKKAAAPHHTTTKKAAAAQHTTTKKAAAQQHTTTKKAAARPTTTKKAASPKTTTKKAAAQHTTTKKVDLSQQTTTKKAAKPTTTKKAATGHHQTASAIGNPLTTTKKPKTTTAKNSKPTTVKTGNHLFSTSVKGGKPASTQVAAKPTGTSTKCASNQFQYSSPLINNRCLPYGGSSNAPSPPVGKFCPSGWEWSSTYRSCVPRYPNSGKGSCSYGTWNSQGQYCETKAATATVAPAPSYKANHARGAFADYVLRNRQYKPAHGRKHVAVAPKAL